MLLIKFYEVYRVFGWGAGFDLVGFDPFLGCLDGGWGGLEPT